MVGCSDFGDVFDTTYFIASLKNSVRIIKELPKNISDRIKDGSMTFFSMPPGSWSNELYYVNTVRLCIDYQPCIVFNLLKAEYELQTLPFAVWKLLI